MTLLTSQFRSSWTWARQKAFTFSTEITPSAIVGALSKGHYYVYASRVSDWESILLALSTLPSQKQPGPITTKAHILRTERRPFLRSLAKYIKKPWEITGPCASPEYLPAIPKAVEWRIPIPATPAIKPCVPSSLPETVYDIKYFSRDQRRNRSPIRKILFRKDDVLKMMSEREFSPEEFRPVYLTDKVEEDQDAIGGGYQK